MNIQNLESLFNSAKKRKKDIQIELTVPGQVDTEVIIVKYSNLDYKWNYYKQNYNEDLTLKRCDKIRMLNVKLLNFTW